MNTSNEHQPNSMPPPIAPASYVNARKRANESANSASTRRKSQRTHCSSSTLRESSPSPAGNVESSLLTRVLKDYRPIVHSSTPVGTQNPSSLFTRNAPTSGSHDSDDASLHRDSIDNAGQTESLSVVASNAYKNEILNTVNAAKADLQECFTRTFEILDNLLVPIAKKRQEEAILKLREEHQVIVDNLRERLKGVEDEVANAHKRHEEEVCNIKQKYRKTLDSISRKVDHNNKITLAHRDHMAFNQMQSGAKNDRLKELRAKSKNNDDLLKSIYERIKDHQQQLAGADEISAEFRSDLELKLQNNRAFVAMHAKLLRLNEYEASAISDSGLWG